MAAVCRAPRGSSSIPHSAFRIPHFPMKSLIILPKTSKYSPAKVGNFIWNEEHQAHLYHGRPLEMAEFNEISKRIFYLRRDEIANFDLPPYVQMVEEKPESGNLRPESIKPKLKRKTPLIPLPDLQIA